MAALETIIQRDFFPELTKLQAQLEYLDAMEHNDFDRMRQISQRFQTPRPGRAGSQHSANATPMAASHGRQHAAPFETPSHAGTPARAATPHVPPATAADAAGRRDPRAAPDTPAPATAAAPVAAAAANDDDDDVPPSVSRAHADVSLSLDAFLQRYTSEDNASFDTLVETARDKLRRRFDGYRRDIRTRQPALTDGSLPGGKAPGVSYALEYWKSADNAHALMLTPEPLGYTAQELIELSRRPGVKINHNNTRFKRDPFAAASTRGSSRQSAPGPGLAGGPAGSASSSTSATPSVNGYKYVATPSPMPGRDMDPLFTWGEVAGQAFPLDGSDVAATPGPAFFVPEPSRREELGHSLANNAAKRKAARLASAGGSGGRATPRGSAAGRTPHDRLASMSPAAQRLAKSIGKGSATNRNSLGDALRRTTPTPGAGAHLGARRTPRVTPRVTPRSSRAATPSAAGGGDSVGVHAPADLAKRGAGLTDNLL